MAKIRLSPRPPVRDALMVLGQLVRAARADRRWTIDELAARAGVSRNTIRALESGAPGTSAGILFEVAYLVGVPIFGIEDRVELARLRRTGEDRLALLPSRVYHQRREPDANF